MQMPSDVICIHPAHLMLQGDFHIGKALTNIAFCATINTNEVIYREQRFDGIYNNKTAPQIQAGMYA